MSSACGRWTIAFNGEAYRFKELRDELDGRRRTQWRGHSDTEVIIEFVAEDGFEQTIRKLSGMFAIAAVDLHEGRLWLASDRAGKKPLYYGWMAGVFAFASELKALAALGSMPVIDRAAAAMMLRYRYVPAPHCIYQGLSKLMPGELASVDLREAQPGAEPIRERYWRVGEFARDAVKARRAGASDPAQLESVLEAAVARRMVSDVPIGAFLSGGVDSSIVCALMARVSTEIVRTFSIGFEDTSRDESHHAERVALALGTDHTNWRITDSDLLEVVPSLPMVFDEPYADPSQIPTCLVCVLARRYVTVALSGDGGDEVFGGYPRYRTSQDRWSAVARTPMWLRRRYAYAVRAGAPIIRWCDRAFSLSHKHQLVRARMMLRTPDVMAGLVGSRTFPEFYRGLMSGWHTPPVLGLDLCSGPADQILSSGCDVAALGPSDWMMATDFCTYLHGDILTKVDRASMACSLEVRCPFLDSDVVDFAWRLPAEHRVGSDLKVILKALARQLVPPEVVDRPKAGFGVPLARWLRGPLKAWMQDLLSPDALRRGGLLDPLPVQAAVSDLLAGSDSEQGRVWSVLMLSEWLRTNRAVADSP
jgi:asparagine synthase (glutamine-hydrolysing)